jgi:O-methyltransferase
MLSRLKDRVARYRAERHLSPVSREVRARRLTYLSPHRLRTLERCAAEVNARGVEGDFVEAGVALGGSAVVLGASMGHGRRLHAYDVFATIPPPGEHDPPEAHERYATISEGRSAGIDGDTYYGYRHDLRDHVARTFAAFGMPVGDRIRLHEGLFEDTLHPEAPVALAHVDSDWHDPVATCLERIAPHLSPGGFILLDDYDDYGGCRDATDAFLARRPRFALARLGTSVAVVHGDRAAA